MTIDKITKTFTSTLSEIYPPEEIKAIVRELFRFYAGYSSMDLIIKHDKIPDKLIENRIIDALYHLKQGDALQYIIGETKFFDLNLKVNPDVLIPRPETEELVQWILEDIEKGNTLNILDIGTGSACIPLALKSKLPKAQLFAIDISEAALKVARENSRQTNLEVSFFQADILNNIKLNFNIKFDVLISNPPYVCESEKAQMHENVLKNEPHIALFVKDEDPLVFYKAIFNFAETNLIAGGKLYFEINESYGKELKKLFKENNYNNIELQKDINGKYRMIKADK